MRIIDISRKLSSHMAVWPGDPCVAIERFAFYSKHGCNVSKMSMGLHSGTHVDAPWHYVDKGEKVLDTDLSLYIGRCKVLEVITGEHIRRENIENLDIQQDDIILFKTKNSYVVEKDGFAKDFCAISLSACEFLIEKKIKTVGIDYLSVEGYEGNGEVHRMILANNIGVLEGLDLSCVSPGEYFLSALPLKLENAEGSPVRAVLIEI